VSFIALCFCGVDCWWIWGEETEDVIEKAEVDEDNPTVMINDNVNSNSLADEQENIIEKEDVKNVHNLDGGIILPDEKQDIVGTPELAKKLDREAFEKKLEEVIKAHEDIHLNTEIHFDPNGEHNDEFDHEAFLGDDADEFRYLSPEESKEKLSKIFEKIDKNNDTFVDVMELTNWIKNTANRSATRRTEEFWKQSNPDNRAELSWDEYRAIQYGFLTDGHITDTDGRWIGEEDVDAETLKQYKGLEQRDRRRWTVADRNKNLQLSKDEFQGFIHPEYAEHMYGIMMSETMGDLDTDGDGKLDLAEYVKTMFGDTKSVSDWENGGLTFRAFRDKNSDGFIDKEELMAWMHPDDYDQNKAEADHLIHEADKDGDKKLIKQEVLDNHNIFVSSQATDFGQDLHYHHDEL